MLVTQPENRRYLSGFTATDASIAESSGVLLVRARQAPLLITDFRYQLEAVAEAGGCEVVLAKGGLFRFLDGLLPRLGIRRLAFEGHYVLYNEANGLIAAARKHGAEAVPVTGIVEKLRRVKSQAEIGRASCRERV